MCNDSSVDDPLIRATAKGGGSSASVGASSQPARRAFKARGSFVERCSGCNLPTLNCLCPYRVEAYSEAQVWLLTHPLEHYKPTNTGRLIGDVLPTTEVFTWYRTVPNARLLALLDDSRYAPFVIFPDDQPDYADRVVGMQRVGEAKLEGRIPVFLILDGTWRQARRIFRKSPYLEALPVLPLSTQRLTRYRLRKPASSAHLCTVEVAIELLRQSGDAYAAAILDDYFDVFNDSYAASRAYYKLEPTAAMHRLASRRAGT